MDKDIHIYNVYTRCSKIPNKTLAPVLSNYMLHYVKVKDKDQLLLQRNLHDLNKSLNPEEMMTKHVNYTRKKETPKIFCQRCHGHCNGTFPARTRHRIHPSKKPPPALGNKSCRMSTFKLMFNPRCRNSHIISSPSCEHEKPRVISAKHSSSSPLLHNSWRFPSPAAAASCPLQTCKASPRPGNLSVFWWI